MFDALFLKMLLMLVIFDVACPAGPGGEGRRVPGAGDQQDEPSQSGARFGLGGAVPRRSAKGQ